jgi:hypothetical protein
VQDTDTNNGAGRLTIVAPGEPPADYGEALRQVVTGNLATLEPAKQAAYVLGVCQSLGLNPATAPLAIMTFKGKTVLYAKKDATEQLRKLHAVSVEIVGRELLDGELYVVTARASLPGGRCDESIGAVSLKGLAGEDRSNALMKAETKAKRRVTLSICGLGFLDESETDQPAAATPARRQVTGEVAEQPAAMKQIADGTLYCTAEQTDAIDVLRGRLGFTEAALAKWLVKKYGDGTTAGHLTHAQAEEVVATFTARAAEQDAAAGRIEAVTEKKKQK